MSFTKCDDGQTNLLDGTIYLGEVHPGEGVYISVAGRDEQVYIVAFDLDDLKVLAEIYDHLKGDDNDDIPGGAA